MCVKLRQWREMASSSHTAKTNIAVRTLIKLLLMAVYLGIVVIWIMAPTNTYRQNWLLRLKSKFNFTTYFGSQGWYIYAWKTSLQTQSLCKILIHGFCGLLQVQRC